MEEANRWFLSIVSGPTSPSFDLVYPVTGESGGPPTVYNVGDTVNVQMSNGNFALFRINRAQTIDQVLVVGVNPDGSEKEYLVKQALWGQEAT